MDVFFQIVGMVVVGGLGFGLAAGGAALWFFRRKLQQVVGEIAEATMAPAPRRVRLQITHDSEWDDPDTATDACLLFRAAGFDEVGTFCSYDIDGLSLAAWVHVEHRLSGVVYEHPQAGIFSDVVAFFEDRGSVTVSNAPDSARMDEPPEHPKIIESSLEVGELIERAQAESAGRELRAISADTFKGDFERAYAEGMDWRNARGGPTEEEIRRIAAEMEEEVDESKVEVIRERYAELACEQLSESCLDFFMDETLLSVSEWEKVREVVVVIHDLMDGRQVIDAFAGFIDLPDEVAEDLFNLEPTGTPAREFFRHLNLRIDESMRYRVLGSVAEPIAADVYSGTPV
jgi:hypothetical protein